MNMRALLCTVVIAALAAVGRSEGELSSKMKDYALELHNEYRAKQRASNMPALVWDAKLETKARKWADACNYKHSGMGENLAWMSIIGSPKEMKKKVKDRLQAWYDEINDWTYGTQSCGRCCHYTQIVWAKTTKVGCAAKTCSPLAGTGWAKPAWWIVCNYDPAGNWVGQYAFLKGAACSKCPSGTSCEDKLCVKGGNKRTRKSRKARKSRKSRRG